MSSVIVPITLACLIQAAELQNVPPAVLLTIQQVEGGKVGEVSRNSNDTYDIGPMQINSIHIDEIANTAFKGDKKAAEERLLNDGCYNAFVGAYLLRKALIKENNNLFEAVGRYHSGTKKYKTRYQSKFIEKFKEIYTLISSR